MASAAVASNAIVSEALNQNNYKDWCSRLETYLLSKDLWDIVKAEPPDVENGEAEYKAWRKKDAKALHAIKISCGTEIFSFIRDSSTSKKAWEVLEKQLKSYTALDFEKKERSRSLSNAGQTREVGREADEGGNENIDEFDSSYGPFFKYVDKGDWDNAKECLATLHPNAIRVKDPKIGYTALHYAAKRGHVDIVKELVLLMTPDDLEIKENDGYTALHKAVIKGNVDIVKQLVPLMRPKGLGIKSNDGETALHIATRLGQVNIVKELVSLMREEDLEIKDHLSYTALSNTLYVAQSEEDLVQIARYLVQKNKKILSMGIPRNNHIAVVKACASGKWELCRYLYSVTPLETLLSDNGTEGAKLISKCIRLGKGLDVAWDLLQRCPRLAVVDNGLVGGPPVLELAHMQYAFLSGKPLTFLQKWIYNSIHAQPVEFKAPEISINVSKSEDDQVNQRDSICSVMSLYRRFVKGRLVILLANLSPLARIRGASLQMQRELQWFKEVESIVPVQMHGYLNSLDGLTASELFTKNHKKLMEEAEISMKGTATSCTTVGALIITIMFAVAFTVPGGTNGNTGFPTFMHKKLFKVFIVADIISLASSSTSVITFLGILTSRYAEHDFLKSLPKKMMIGLSALFISIATMMVAFFCALTIMLDGEAWIIIPSIMFASVPVISFVWFLFPLLVEICISTYGPGIFVRNLKPWY